MRLAAPKLRAPGCSTSRTTWHGGIAATQLSNNGPQARGLEHQHAAAAESVEALAERLNRIGAKQATSHLMHHLDASRHTRIRGQFAATTRHTETKPFNFSYAVNKGGGELVAVVSANSTAATRHRRIEADERMAFPRSSVASGLNEKTAREIRQGLGTQLPKANVAVYPHDWPSLSWGSDPTHLPFGSFRRTNELRTVGGAVTGADVSRGVGNTPDSRTSLHIPGSQTRDSITSSFMPGSNFATLVQPTTPVIRVPSFERVDGSPTGPVVFGSKPASPSGVSDKRCGKLNIPIVRSGLHPPIHTTDSLIGSSISPGARRREPGVPFVQQHGEIVKSSATSSRLTRVQSSNPAHCPCRSGAEVDPAGSARQAFPTISAPPFRGPEMFTQSTCYSGGRSDRLRWIALRTVHGIDASEIRASKLTRQLSCSTAHAGSRISGDVAICEHWCGSPTGQSRQPPPTTLHGSRPLPADFSPSRRRRDYSGSTAISSGRIGGGVGRATNNKQSLTRVSIAPVGPTDAVSSDGDEWDEPRGVGNRPLRMRV